MPDTSPQSLGRYAIHAELGKGGFATVYRATDTMLERDVALKVLKPGWTDDAKAVERFMREALVIQASANCSGDYPHLGFRSRSASARIVGGDADLSICG